MSKNVHHIDKFFLSELETNKVEPSSEVWENLTAKLDKRDARLYKKKYANLKRAASFLLLLFLSLAIYEGVQLQHTKQHGKPKAAKTSDTPKSAELETRVQNSTTDKQTETNVVKSAVQKNVPIENAISHGDFLPTDKNGLSIFLQGKKMNNRVISTQPDIKLENSTRLQQFSIVTKETTSINQVDVSSPSLSMYMPTFFPHYVGINLSSIQTAKPPELALLPVIKKDVFKPFWSSTAFVSIDLSQYKLEDDLPDNVNGQVEDSKQEVQDREEHEVSFSTGILASCQLKKQLALQTGFIYSNSDINIDPQQVYAVKNPSGEIAYKFNLSSGYTYIKPRTGSSPIVGDSVATTGALHNLHSFSFPVMLLYTKESGRFSFSPGAGVTANILTAATLRTEIEDASGREKIYFSKLEGVNRVSLGVIAMAGVRYKINNKLSVSLLPTFRHSLTSITTNSVVKTYPYSYSIGAGLSLKF